MMTNLRKAQDLVREFARQRPVALPPLSARMMLVVIGSILLIVIVYLTQSSQAALLSRSLQLKQQRLGELQRANAELRLQIAALTLPSNVEPKARALGLGPATSVVYADLPNLQVEMADVLPAFDPLYRPVPREADLGAQFVLWWDNVRTQLGIVAGSPARAASPAAGSNLP